MNKILFALCFGIGLLIAGLNPFTAWLHETGHVESFHTDGIKAFRSSERTTSTERITKNGLAAGAMAEFMFFFTLVVACYCAGNPQAANWRKNWFYVGLPFGACHLIYIRAFSYTDFHREWSIELLTAWTMIITMILILSWLILIFTRFVEK